jgi:hypothetical protein
MPCFPEIMSAQPLLLSLSTNVPLNDGSQLLEMYDVVNDAADTHLAVGQW